MQIVVDENLSRELVQQLQQQGHLVWFVPDVQPGLKNGEVLNYANQQEALLITGDKSDFGELIFRQGKLCLGLLVVRLPAKMVSTQRVAAVAGAIAEYGEQLLGKIAVLAEQQMRIRQLPETVVPSPNLEPDVD